MTLRQINFEEGYVLVSYFDEDKTKLELYPKEKINPFWEEVKDWLSNQKLTHTILIGRLTRQKKKTPYCLVWRNKHEKIE